MTPIDRLERDLATWLAEAGVPRRLDPQTLDDILARTRRTRQRPAWTFPERWLPLSAISIPRRMSRPFPLRTFAILVLLLALVVAAVAVYAGSQRHVPAPFGVAGNGLVAFTNSSRDLVVGSPGGGAPRVIASGAGWSRPTFSADGTRLAALRTAANGGDDIVVMRPDGSDQRVVTDQPLFSVSFLQWSPDGSSLMAASHGRLLSFASDRQAAPRVVGINATTGLDDFGFNPAGIFRPPDGRQIAYIRDTDQSLIVADADGGNAHAVVAATRPDIHLDRLSDVQWSPDGKRLVFMGVAGENVPWRAYVVDADGANLHLLRTKVSTDGHSESNPAWSPDGTRVAFEAWQGQQDGTWEPRPVTILTLANGDETEVGHVQPNGFRDWAWSPDGRQILELPDDGGGVNVVDVASGQTTELGTGWETSVPARASWQRVAP